MKNFKTLMAALLAVTVAAPSMAVVTNVQINDRISAILDKIGVDGTGFDSTDNTDYGTLGNFDASGITWGGQATSQLAADSIASFTIDNTTTYVPAGGRDNETINTDLESMLLDALSFKIDEITGDISDLTTSYTDGSLAFQTIIDNRTGLNGDDSINYGSAEAQVWFGVKNSLDIFTASANAWVAGIGELNSTGGTDGSHFANGAVLSETYDDSKDDTSDVMLAGLKTFAADGTMTDLADLNLGYGYDRDSLAAASGNGVSDFATVGSIKSGETIFSTERHTSDVNGYAADILGQFDAASIVTETVVGDQGSVYLENLIMPTLSGTYFLVENSSGIMIWQQTGSTLEISTSMVNTNVNSPAYGTVGSSYTTNWASSAIVLDTLATVFVIADGAIDGIKNSEIKGYATELLTQTVNTSSPQWLQDLAAGI